MGRENMQREADVFIGVRTWQGDDPGDDPPAAEVIRLAPYLLARRRRAAAPPARGV